MVRDESPEMNIIIERSKRHNDIEIMKVVQILKWQYSRNYQNRRTGSV